MADTPGIDHVEVLAAEGAALISAVHDGPHGVPIAACPGWNLLDLAAHIGVVWRWSTKIVNERRNGPGQLDPAPALTPEQAAGWLEEGLVGMLDALRCCPAGTPVWGFGQHPRTEAFWRRRQAIETVVHRVDAELAIGELAPVAPAVAADGIGEFIDVLLPRLHRGQEELPAGQLQVTAVDTGGGWTIGDPTAGVGTLSGRAEDLLLVLWGRRDEDGVQAGGDRAVLRGWRSLGAP